MTPSKQKLFKVKPGSTLDLYLHERSKRMSPWPAVCFWFVLLCLWAVWARSMLN